ncbi:hypothetical protein LCGC14_1406370 [marine sediment metagenome]|uniref:Uncharacterized protein n=1 Tax=marine sediment metagenome TaxID=412755 RepID=A0A0F9KGJ7_9ZZZZ
MNKKYCIECVKEISESRIKQYKKRGIKTCSKRCSVNRSLTSSRDRKKWKKR